MQDKTNQVKQLFITTLGEIIEKHRKELNKTIYKISAETSVPRSTWRDVEFGVSRDINLTNFCKIAEGLDIPADKLLGELLQKLGKDFSFTDLNT